MRSGERETDRRDDFFLLGDVERDLDRDFDLFLRRRGDREVDLEPDLFRRRLSRDILLRRRRGDLDRDFDLDRLREDFPALRDRLLRIGDLLRGDLRRDRLRLRERRLLGGDLVRDLLLRCRRSRDLLLLREDRAADGLRERDREVKTRGRTGSTDEGLLTASRCAFRTGFFPEAILSLSGLTIGFLE